MSFPCLHPAGTANVAASVSDPIGTLLPSIVAGSRRRDGKRPWRHLPVSAWEGEGWQHIVTRVLIPDRAPHQIRAEGRGRAGQHRIRVRHGRPCPAPRHPTLASLIASHRHTGVMWKEDRMVFSNCGGEESRWVRVCRIEGMQSVEGRRHG